MASIMYLMRFHSLKFGSFEKFLIHAGGVFTKDHRVIYVFQSKPPAWLHEKLKDVGVDVEWCSFETSLINARRLIRIIHKYKPDVVHLHFFSLLTHYIPLLKMAGVRKLIAHIHSISPYDAPENLFKRTLLPFRKRIALWSIEKAVCVSRYVKGKTLEYFRFRKGQLVTIYNGPIDDSGDGSKENAEATNASDRQVTILAGGWLTPIKGIDTLVQSLPQVVANTSMAIKVKIIGDGPQKAELVKAANELKVDGIIDFLGWRDDVPQLIDKSHIVVAVSKLPDAFPYFILEAMNAGKAIIGSDIGGIPEMLRNRGVPEQAQAGMLVPPDNPAALSKCMVRLLNDSCLREKLGQNAKKKIKRDYNTDTQIEMLSSLYFNNSVYDGAA